MPAAVADDINHALFGMSVAVRQSRVSHVTTRPTSKTGAMQAKLREVDVHSCLLGMLLASDRGLTTVESLLRFPPAAFG